MAKPIAELLPFLLLFSSFAATTATRTTPTLMTGPTAPTAYDILEKYGFPRGILPEGVTSYLLRTDGTFEVYFGDRLGDCSFKVTGYQLEYKRQITGKLEQGAIKDLKGVSVKVLFVWLGITQVSVSGDGQQLEFSVGPVSASFDMDNFGECPRCGCGFDCSSRGLDARPVAAAEAAGAALDS